MFTLQITSVRYIRDYYIVITLSNGLTWIFNLAPLVANCADPNLRTSLTLEGIKNIKIFAGMGLSWGRNNKHEVIIFLDDLYAMFTVPSYQSSILTGNPN